MHFEVLVEDASGKIVLEELVEKILGRQGGPHTWKIISYKGIGRVPPNLRGKPNPQKRLLLDNLPRILKGYGRSLPPKGYGVIIVMDLDDKNCKFFKNELNDLLSLCSPAPSTRFRIAIDVGNGG